MTADAGSPADVPKDDRVPDENDASMKCFVEASEKLERLCATNNAKYSRASSV